MLMRPSILLKTHALPLWQTEEWARTLRTLGRDASIEALGSCGQALVVQRQFGPFGTIRFTSRGPQWAEGATDQDKCEALKAARFHVINLDQPDSKLMRRAGYWPLFKPKTIAWLKVQTDLDAQLSAAHPKWRNAVRQAMRLKPRISHDAFDQIRHGWLFTEDRKQQRQKGFKGQHPVLTRAFDQANPDHVTVSQMWQGETSIAAMIFLRHGASATYQTGWTSEAGRAANAHHLILMKASQKLARKGVSQIDLGLYMPQSAPGLARFKLRSGATLHPLGGTWIRRPFS